MNRLLRSLQIPFLLLGWILHLPLCVQAATPAVSRQSQDSGSQSVYAALSLNQAYERIGNYLDVVRELRGQIDESQFDAEALVERLEFDSSKILSFVKNEIAYQPYAGALRGVRGTLIGLAGNALDQSMLLASLLKSAGLEARIVRSTLSAEQAIELLKQTAPAKVSLTPWKDAAKARDIMGKAIMSAGGKQEDVAKLLLELDKQQQQDYPLYQEAEQSFSTLLAALEGSAQLRNNAELPQSILKEAQDYFYVESRLSNSQPWSAYHPAFQAEVPFKDLKPLSYFTDSIPAELQHHYRVEFMVEQKVGSELKVQSIMKAIEGPVVNMIDMPFSYMNLPEKLASASFDIEPAKAIEESDSYFPVLNNGLAPDAKAFDIRGTIIPADVLASSMAGIFKEVGKKTNMAASALSEIGSSAKDAKKAGPLTILTAQFFDVTLTAPAGQKKTQRRFLLDRLTAEGRSTNKAIIDQSITDADARQLLAQQVSFMPSVGRLNAAFILDKVLERFINSQPLYEIYAARTLEPDVKHSMALSKLKSVDARWLGHFPMYYAFDQIQERHPETAIYRHEPAVVAISSNFPGSKAPLQRSDILFHSQRALKFDGQKLSFDQKLLAKAGVWESYAEEFGLESLDGTSSAERLATVSAKLTVIAKAEDLNGIADSKLRSNLQEALSTGYLVAHSTDSSVSDWWRINPESGETLALSREGRGEAALGTVMLIISISMAVMFAIIGYGACAVGQGVGGGVKACCIADSLAYGTGGFLAGLLIGKFMMAITAMMFLDIAGGYTMFALGVTGVLPSFC